jgi:hypothetical protein
MKKRKKSKTAKRRVRMSPLRLIEGDDFHVNRAQRGRIDISATGMARVMEEWLKGRTAILVVDGSDAVRIEGKPMK